MVHFTALEGCEKGVGNLTTDGYPGSRKVIVSSIVRPEAQLIPSLKDITSATVKEKGVTRTWQLNFSSDPSHGV